MGRRYSPVRTPGSQRMAGMVSISEVLPDEHNIITLNLELKDHDGIPAPGIDYRLSENSRNMLNFSIARAMEVLEAARRDQVAVNITHCQWPLAPDGNRTNGHRPGKVRGQRVGTQPRREEPVYYRRQHFFKSAGVNPTRKIQALALYVADNMKQRLANLFD